MREIYLDNNATTTLAPQAREAMLPYFDAAYGNASSLHRKGVEAARAIQDGRIALANCLGADASEVVFTSGATESINLAIKGVARARRRRGKHIVTTLVEHDAVLASCADLEREGCETTQLATDEWGRVSASDLSDAIRDDTILVAVMHVNNELGSINRIGEIAEAAKRRKPDVVLFSDGAQAFGKLPVSLRNIDLYAVSAHKLHGPKGIGALFVRQGVRIEPLLSGGGHERGLRPGTENTPGVVGFAAAAEAAYGDLAKHREGMRRAKQRFLNGVGNIRDARVNSPSDGLETTANVAFPGVPGETLLHALEEKGVYVSTGSACSSKNRGVSRVLAALPIPDETRRSSLRFGFSRYTTLDDVDATLSALREIVPKFRRIMER